MHNLSTNNCSARENLSLFNEYDRQRSQNPPPPHNRCSSTSSLRTTNIIRYHFHCGLSLTTFYEYFRHPKNSKIQHDGTRIFQ